MTVTQRRVNRPMPATRTPPDAIRSVFDDGQIRRMLGEAPVGHHPLLEAAFAWHERRPDGRCPQPAPDRSAPRGGPPRYLPIMITHGMAASRLTRLLSTLTWAIATPVGESLAESHPLASVEVPAHEYHRVGRALNAAWRGRWKLLKAPGGDSETRQAARAVWRMALLVDGHWREDGLAVRVSTSSGLSTLTVAAKPLGLTLAATGPRPGSTILIPDSGQLSHLLRD